MKQTKQSKVLNYLMTHENGLTSMEAFEMFNATRLAAIVFVLKKRGYNIISEDCGSLNSDGEYVHYSRYKFVGKETEAQ